MPQQVPIVNYLELGDPPRLKAHACTACGALYFDRRNACARCSGTDFSFKALSSTGHLRAFTIVYRAERPYTSAIVDLDGGGVVKTNLLGIDDPAKVTPRMPLILDTFVAGTDDEGTEAIAFGFRPRGEQR
jgi:uncharacterized protein